MALGLVDKETHRTLTRRDWRERFDASLNEPLDMSMVSAQREATWGAAAHEQGPWDVFG